MIHTLPHTKILLACLALVGLSFFATAPTANAAVSGWKAGNIMTDAVMSDKTTMSVSEIQAFLNKQVACDTNGIETSELGGGTRAQYGAANGFAAPFICLESYYESPTSTYTAKFTYKDKAGVTKTKYFTYTANNYYKITGFKVTYVGGDYKKGIARVKPITANVNKVKPSGAKSAASLIYSAAQEFSINPQVLIVLLQKEQSLVTDEWPAPIQYYSATGYGCPDTAPCDPDYANFRNQIRAAARMFRAILNNSSTWYTPYVLGQNYIQYSPNSSCGGSTVNIENRATQALYNYTPYQPNKAALDAGWGSAPCGAYGNRNFYLYFTSWFGSTRSLQNQGLIAIQNRYNALDQTTKTNLGSLKGASTCTSSTTSCYQMYDNGAIIWSNKTGAWENYGGIRTRWSQLGYQSGTMGYPTGAMVSTEENGYYQRYQNGYIIGKPTTGYWESKGAIRDRWAQLGYEAGSMGYPTSAEINMGDRSYYQKFEGGFIIGKGGLGFWESYAPIRTRWAQLGYQTGSMGFPTGAITSTGDGGYYQRYQNGYIIGKPTTGYWESKGAIRDRWAQLGYQTGSMGYPTSGIVRKDSNNFYQQYEHNKIFYRLPSTTWVGS
ncbi:MAG TPA: hypothetical protein VGE13_04615 [Candidatus Saccharimonadales bacterium]